MCLDQNTVLIVVALIGVAGYAAQNWLIKWRELQKREYARKEQRYANFVRLLAKMLSPRILREKKVPEEIKEKLNQEVFLLQLYAPDNVVRAMDKWVNALSSALRSAVSEDELRNALRNLLISMRKDLRKTELKKSEIHIYRAE